MKPLIIFDIDDTLINFNVVFLTYLRRVHDVNITKELLDNYYSKDWKCGNGLGWEQYLSLGFMTHLERGIPVFCPYDPCIGTAIERLRFDFDIRFVTHRAWLGNNATHMSQVHLNQAGIQVFDGEIIVTDGSIPKAHVLSKHDHARVAAVFDDREINLEGYKESVLTYLVNQPWNKNVRSKYGGLRVSPDNLTAALVDLEMKN